jgi:hypothetical protein
MKHAARGRSTSSSVERRVGLAENFTQCTYLLFQIMIARSCAHHRIRKFDGTHEEIMGWEA